MGKLAGIKLNDVANAPGVSVSVYLQGCPHHCPGCFNPETWDFNGGENFTEDDLKLILNGLDAYGIKRSLCILGGEPLCEQNLSLTRLIIDAARQKDANVNVYIWTGYVYEHLKEKEKDNNDLKYILANINVLVDGPFILSQKDLGLKMRGSSNQRIIELNPIKV